MATFTTNYALRKPATGDLIEESTDINASMDTIDAELDDHRDRVVTLNTRKVVVVRKTADETVSSSTTLQNDDELFYAIPATGTYIIDTWLIVDGGGTPDIQIDFTWTNGTVDHLPVGLDVTATSTAGDAEFISNVADAASPVPARAFGIDNSVSTIHSRIIFQAVGAQTFRLRWAQDVSGATATKVWAGSHMIIRRIT
jgi:hypothetical protein